MRRILLLVLLATFALPALAQAQELGFLEEYAISDDREKTLGKLVPGTREYYYYHCLHYQLTGQYDKVHELAKLWQRRYGENQQLRGILHRQALLEYPQNNQKSLEYLIRYLNIRYNHHRITNKKPDYPTRLDPKVYGQQSLVKTGRSQYNNLHGVTDAGLRWLNPQDLSWRELRDWLKRMEYPDYDNLPELILKDLRNKQAGTFGYLPIHNKLTLAQLQQLRSMDPKLLSNQAFINAYLRRLRPGPDVDWKKDSAAREAYLNKLWAFVKDLPPVWNSLKANIRYQILMHARNEGRYDAAMFMDYIQMPRNVWYINPKFMRQQDSQRNRVNLNANFHDTIGVVSINNDEALVRDYLEHFFLEAEDYEKYLPYMKEEYLQKVFAETKIVGGVGDMEKWYSLLSPEDVQRIKDRVDIDFLPQNKSYFTPGDKVSLKAAIKNVDKLLVRVYKINTANWYRKERRAVPLDIDLEGLISSDETTHEYEQIPTRRVVRDYEFPQIEDRGVYVIDFVGNGVSSRAVVTIGSFRLLERKSSGGHVFSILDESNQLLKDASLWLDGHEYTPDENGLLRVPFSTNPGRRKAVAQRDGFAAMVEFNHIPENYALQAGFYVDRETLLAGQTATLLIRPRLNAGDTEIPATLVKDTVLTIRATDVHGVPTTKVMRDIKLDDGKETEVEFAVPENMVHLHVRLEGKVETVTTGSKVDVASEDSFVLNQIEKSDKVEQLLLSKTAEGYQLRLVGKTGEARAGQPINLALHSPLVRHTVHTTVQTDANGIAHLGDLAGLEWIQTNAPSGVNNAWKVATDAVQLQPAINAPTGKPIPVAYGGMNGSPERKTLGLLRVSPQGYSEDLFNKLSIAEGYIIIDKLAMGDYLLVYHQTGQTLPISVTEGKILYGWILGKNRLLEITNPAPLQVAPAVIDQEVLSFKVHGANKSTRVHLTATRFLPAYGLFGKLDNARWPSPMDKRPGCAETVYQSGRAVGDEVRYILERRLETIFPGNMLRRPSLILNPWSPEETTTGKDHGAADGDFAERHGGGRGQSIRRAGGSAPQRTFGAAFMNLDFLAQPAVTMYNLTPDEDGIVTIKRADLKGHQNVHVLAVKPGNTVYRQIALMPTEMETKDLRFKAGLDPEKHFAEDKSITALHKGDTLKIRVGGSTDAQFYTTIGDVFDLYQTLSKNPDLRKFDFIKRWDTLKQEEKDKRYADNACHELHVFLYHKDKEFFDKTVKPYLANKMDKQFIDKWLLEEDLSDYLEPWAFGKLNTVEKILLAKRVQQQHASVARWVKEQTDLLPPDPERFNYLFDTALQAAALSSGGNRGVVTLKLNRTTTGELSFGAGFSSSEIIRGPVSVTQRDYEQEKLEGLASRNSRGEKSSGKVRSKYKDDLSNVIGTATPSSTPPQPPAPTMEAVPAPPDDAPTKVYDSRDLDYGVTESRTPPPSEEAPAPAYEAGLYYAPSARKSLEKKLEDSRMRVMKERRANAPRGDKGKILQDEVRVEAYHNTLQIQQGYHYGLNMPNNWDEIVQSRQDDLAGREGLRRLFRQVPPTRAWVENNYYRLPIKQQTADLIPDNPFWAEYAAHEGDGFLSKYLAECERNLPSMMLALAVLDLPFEAPQPEGEMEEEDILQLQAATPMVVFHKEIEPASPAEDVAPVLVGQNLFRADDRYRHENNQRFEKYVSGELLAHTVYGCQVVVTNPTSRQRRFEALIQIPNGSLPVSGSYETRSVSLALGPYQTRTVDYFFYFPTPGEYGHFPVHVAEKGELAAFAKGKTLKVVETLDTVDKTSWPWISQNGTLEEVLAYMEANNIARTNLNMIAWRMQEEESYKQILAFLTEKHVYNHTLWSYALKYNDKPNITAYLEHANHFVSMCGMYLTSELLTIDPVIRTWYEHIEFDPLVHARAHKFGKRRKILNPRIFTQYQRLMQVLSYHKEFGNQENLALSYYMFLQDRVGEGLDRLERVDASKLPERIQYDYFTVYADFYKSDIAHAKTVAETYKEYPVERWRYLFGGALAQIAQIEGKDAKTVDKENREEQQNQLASSEPTYEFEFKDGEIELAYKNIEAVTVNYYAMDIELLFSREPFQQGGAEQFAYVEPTESKEVELKKDGDKATIALPDTLRTGNLMVEIVAGGDRQSAPYFANAMDVLVARNYGALQVTGEKDKKALPKVYVKAYARMQSGEVRFWKDGYTDLRGSFDYATVSGAPIASVESFSILILSKEHGALIKEVDAPQM